MSMTGNVAHAVLHASAGTIALAAGAALVPPVVLLAATHSVALLVRTRAGGFIYWCALLMTLALASCAFVLSFDALRSLAMTLGLPGSIAWLWPCAIDVAIAQATLCLLSLSRPRAVESVVREAQAPSKVDGKIVRPERLAQVSPNGRTPNHTVGRRPNSEARERTASPARDGPPRAATFVGVREDSAAVKRWKPIAESLVRERITSKNPDLVARILAQREAGVPPSTIGRTYKVHHTTVGRILSAAEELTA